MILANTIAGINAYNAPFEKSKVIYNGFNFDRIKKLENKESIRQKFKIKTENVIGMVASFNEKKDYETYLKGAVKILGLYEDTVFLCIGSGEYSNFKELIPKRYESKILFLGKQREVESIMNICKIGVLLTNENHGEGISNALLEFMALGKPVVATKNGGTPELVEDGSAGFLIKSHSVDQLVEKLLFFLKNEKERKLFGKSGELIVKRKFEISKMIDEFIETYDNVLESAKSN